MTNRWTGGQYSLLRALFGASLAVHFARLLPAGAELFSSQGVIPDGRTSPLIHALPNVLAVADGPHVVTALLVAALIASLALVVGWRDRIAAVVVWYGLVCLHGRNPLAAHPALAFAGWMLLAHAVAVPAAPFGSWAARGRLDPGGGWAFPPGVFGAAWIVIAAAYSYGGLTKLMIPTTFPDGPQVLPLLAAPTLAVLYLELLYAPLALVRRLRPWLWAAMAVVHLARLGLEDPAQALTLLLVHAFTFDPGWIPARAAAAEPSLVLYDGACGFCHASVRVLLAEDVEGTRFRFAPLQGERARAVLDEARRAAAGDTMLVIAPDGSVRSRSDAAAFIAERLGGLWRLGGGLLASVPRAWRDAAYDGVARIRHRLATAPKEACPILPPPLRARFEA